MTPEGKVKAQVKKVLKELGAYYAMPMGTGYGNSGVPDFLVCYKGQFIGIECKANGNVTTALQEKNLAEIRAAGGTTLVINENTVNDLSFWLNYYIKEKSDGKEGITQEQQGG